MEQTLDNVLKFPKLKPQHDGVYREEPDQSPPDPVGPPVGLSLLVARASPTRRWPTTAPLGWTRMQVCRLRMDRPFWIGFKRANSL